MNWNYKIIGADGKEYGPVDLAEMKQWIGEGRITGSTHISRSDRGGWSTAASFPELGVKDQVGPAPAAAASAADPVLEGQLKNGASWFYWIAGLSLINSAASLSGSDWGFILGLGITQIIDAIAHGMSSGVGLGVAIVMDLLVAGAFIYFGVFANKRRNWSFIVGMILYSLDGLIFLFVQDWLGLGFHVFALWCIFSGFKACRQLNSPS